MKIGDKVRLTSTGEVGVVVWMWKNEQDIMDCYVAFFGDTFPEGIPEQPYVLRYYESSLEVIR
jgi:hypothetical protein